jgi:hypothetical protein
MSVSYGGDSITFGDGTIVSSGSQGFKNKIINGHMMIDQRNAGAALTYSASEAVYNVDRWQAGAIGGGTFTTRQMDSANTSASNYESSSAPTGFTNSLKITVGTADTSLASADRYSIYQYIEGNNVADLDFGIATAKTVTVSFWTKSSVVGTYGVYLANAAYSRSNPSTFTINVANTWEYKTITFAGDITGTWLKGNTTGLVLGVSFAMGTTYQGTKDTWTASAVFTTSSQTNFMATSGNTFYITGVQLEKGTTASTFEFRSIQKELILCQRYYYKQSGASQYIRIGTGFVGAGSTTTLYAMVNFPVTMRIKPYSIDWTGNLGIWNGGGISAVSNVTLESGSESTTTAVAIGTSTGLTAQTPYQLIGNNSATAAIAFNAEL